MSDVWQKVAEVAQKSLDKGGMVDHPKHYGGEDNLYEAIKVIEAWGLGFHEGNAIKYISRHLKKGTPRQDIEKAIWYLKRYLDTFPKDNT